MSAAAQRALDDLVQTLVEIRDLLVAHGQARDIGAFTTMGSMAEHDEGSPEQVLNDIWRARQHMSHRDGIGELRIHDSRGHLDREATSRLTALRERMDAILREWGPDEHDGFRIRTHG